VTDLRQSGAQIAAGEIRCRKMMPMAGGKSYFRFQLAATDATMAW